MQTCCFKCGSTKDLDWYGVTEDHYIVSKEKERIIRTIGRFFSFGLANPPRIDHHDHFCPKCAKSGKSS